MAKSMEKEIRSTRIVMEIKMTGIIVGVHSLLSMGACYLADIDWGCGESIV